jgi:branched-chain amino acid transport system ATP-binding protein
MESARATDPALLAEGLEVKYNRVAIAVDDVSITVPHESIVAILGANGAGKTSTLRALTGFLPSEPGRLTRGRVTLFGEEQAGRRPDQITRSGLFLVPERDKVFSTLTVDDNLSSVPTRKGGDRDGMLDLAFQLFPALEELRGRLAGLLSGGERQMLAISRALVADPRLLLVDELSLGLAPAVVARMMLALGEIRRLRGISIVIVEQNALAALRISDYAYILQNGRVATEGASGGLLESPDVRATYLGLGDGDNERRFGERRGKEEV